MNFAMLKYLIIIAPLYLKAASFSDSEKIPITHRATIHQLNHTTVHIEYTRAYVARQIELGLPIIPQNLEQLIPSPDFLRMFSITCVYLILDYRNYGDSK